MLIKMQEAQTVSTTSKDPTGRTIAEAKVVCRDVFINSEHIVSINEDVETSRNAGETFSRIETTRGSFVVRGTPAEIQNRMDPQHKSKSVLKG